MSYQKFTIPLFLFYLTYNSICDAQIPVVDKFEYSLDLKLKPGSNCIFGINCESKFCSPTLRVCVASPTATIDNAAIHDSTARKYHPKGGVCSTPYEEPYSCLTANNGEPLEEWDISKCGCVEEFVSKVQDGSWLCGVPQNADMNKEEQDWAMSMAEADKAVNEVTKVKAMELNRLITKLKKIDQLLKGEGFSKRAYKGQDMKKLAKMGEIVNIVVVANKQSQKKSGDAAANTNNAAANTNNAAANTNNAAANTNNAAANTNNAAANTNNAAANSNNANNAETPAQEKTPEEIKKEEEAKLAEEERIKREEEEKKKKEEEEKLVNDYKKSVDDLVTSIEPELDTQITKYTTGFKNILAEIENSAVRRSVQTEFKNDLNQMKSKLESIINKMQNKKHVKKSYKFKQRALKNETAPAADNAAATPAANNAAATPAADNAAAANTNAADSANNATDSANTGGDTAQTADAKIEEMKKQIDENKKKAEEAIKKAEEDRVKAEEDAKKAAEEAAVAAATKATKDVEKQNNITEVIESAKKVRELMEDSEFKDQIGKLYSLKTKILKRQLQEQSINDIKALIAFALSDPMINGSKRGALLKNKKNLQQAINKMTDEVYIIESRIARVSQILNDVKSMVQSTI